MYVYNYHVPPNNSWFLNGYVSYIRPKEFALQRRLKLMQAEYPTSNTSTHNVGSGITILLQNKSRSPS